MKNSKKESLIQRLMSKNFKQIESKKCGDKCSGKCGDSDGDSK